MLGEDVQDQRGAVDNLDLDGTLQAPQLAGREFAVADDRVSSVRGNDLGQFPRLARSDVGSGVRPAAALDQRVQYLRTGCLRQPG